VITGASGAGKSTLLATLSSLGYSVVPEIALAIVQRARAERWSAIPVDGSPEEA
jgi:predicted ATPase